MWFVPALKALLMIFPIIKEFVNGKHGMVAYVKENPFSSFLFFATIVIFVSLVGSFTHSLKLQGYLYEAKMDIAELRAENRVLREELRDLLNIIERKSNP